MVTLSPLIDSLPADAVGSTELTNTPLSTKPLTYQFDPLIHSTGFLPRHGQFLLLIPYLLPMCPVCTLTYISPARGERKPGLVQDASVPRYRPTTLSTLSSISILPSLKRMARVQMA